MNTPAFFSESEKAGGPQTDFQDIAIIGISGRYPMAENLDEFWRNLASGRDCVSRLPDDRWQAGHPQLGSMGDIQGGFLKDADCFDSLFFNITPREAAKLDPQERLFVQCAYAAIEDAGYTRKTLGKSASSRHAGQSRVGVFAGAMYQEYQFYGIEASLISDSTASGGVAASIANRVSFFCGFNGPSLTLDTMCSSSITAIHLACQSLHLQECEVALAGGVNLSLHPNKYRLLRDNKFLSHKGRCRSFASGGDGYIPSEGVGVVVLKPLATALLDGDQIHGVIKASVINHGGHSSGYYVPNAEQQSALIKEAIDKAGIDPRHIQYVEAHGTGTPVGDPVELKGLCTAFGAYTQDKQFCAIGSVKSNIGHSESAAGVAALSKIVLQMKHGQLAPSLYADETNPDLNFRDSPFYVQRDLEAWSRETDEQGHERPRMASLSSYGAGGSNAHLIIAEYLPPPRGAKAPPQVAPVLLLSAPNQAALKLQARQLLQFFQAGGVARSQTLIDCAYTLQVGREAFDWRLGFVAMDVAAAIVSLERFLEAPDEPAAHILHGRIGRSAVSMDIEAGADPQQCLRAWIEGADIDWAKLYGDVRPVRVSLPTYPFSRNKLWLKTDTRLSPLKDEHGAHPLLGQHQPGTSTFTSTFSGQEGFLADHQVDGNPILPAVAYLEMARAAHEALSAHEVPLSLHKLMWSRPAQVINAVLDMRISLSANDSVTPSFVIESTDASGHYLTCARGTIGKLEEPAPPVLDLQAFIARHCQKRYEGADCYRHFTNIGLDYGRSHQTIEYLHAGAHHVVARLSLAQFDTHYQLHPSMADGAFQAIIGFYLGVDRSVGLPVPFALERVDLHRACSSEMWCIVSRSKQGDGKVFDIQLLDVEGRLCALFNALTIKDFSAAKRVAANTAPATVASGTNVSLAVEWRARQWTATPAPVPSKVLQIGTQDGIETELSRLLPQRVYADHRELGSRESCERLLTRAGEFDEILWVAPTSGADLIQAQETGLLSLFRLIKTLLSQGRHTRQLSLTLVTSQAQSVFEAEPVFAAHASVHGLVGALAKEMRKWRFRMIDLDGTCPWPLEQLLALPFDAKGETWAWRAGQWYQQCLMACHEPLVKEAQAFRRHGVYVILGGAGGIGKVLSRYLIEHYDANVIWLGRRSLEQGVAAQLDSFSDLSHPPIYFQADATDAAALAQAHRQIRQRFAHIHGVINSAIVLQDQSVLTMDEQTFALVLGTKVASSVNIAAVFGNEQLDFMLFFSSLVAFLKTAGQSNYAAGSVFQDTFAHHLRSVCRFPVKIMNWGYWEAFGAGASEHYRQRMASIGVAGIDTADGVAAVEFLLRSSLSQLGFIHMLEFTNLSIVPGMVLDRALEIADQHTSVSDVKGVLARAAQQMQALIPQNFDAAIGATPKVAASTAALPVEAGRVQAQRSVKDAGEPLPDLRSKALAHMAALVSEALQVPLDELDVSTPLVRYGVDSISAVYITNALGEVFGSVDGTLLFDLQTIEELADHFLSVQPQVYADFFATVVADDSAPSMGQPAVLAGEDLRIAIVLRMRTVVSNALEVALDELDDSTPLVRYGVDSISAVYITNALGELFGTVDSSLLFDVQTIDELADYFLTYESDACAELVGAGTGVVGADNAQGSSLGLTPPLVSAPKQATAVEPQLPMLAINRDDDIAIVGMAGRYPQALDLPAFWHNLLNGVHCIEEIPAQRWDWRTGFSDDPELIGGCYTRWGGFIAGHDEFDPVFFHISPAEAELMDPQERLILQHTYACIEDAGYTPKALSSGGEVGVFVGVMNSDYPLVSRYWSIANRVSYVFDFRGPSIALDTACSSSLTALHMAAESIRGGTCASALVGGVNLITDPVHLSSLSYMQMLSHGNACRAFGDQADGFVASEGVGVVMLKSLGQARREGDHIYGVIKGSMIGAGGRTSGYTVPSPRSQSQVMVQALERAGIAAQDVSYIEAHGTGTALGDPIEIKGLVGAYAAPAGSEQTCALGSVKSNIGHAESAAGMAGLSKILLQMKHGMLAPTLHAQPGNPRIDFSQTPLRLVQTAQVWERRIKHQDGHTWLMPRIAGLSSFGAGGANAHLLIAEDDQRHESTPCPMASAIVLSAQSLGQLHQRIDDLLQHLHNEKLEDTHLARLAFTLQTGRETLEWRLGFIVRDMAHLSQCLRQLLDSDWSQLSWLASDNSVPRSKPTLPPVNGETPWSGAALQQRIDNWVQGDPMDWAPCHARQPQRLSLPGYPFRRDRYWLAPSHDLRRLTPTADGRLPSPVSDSQALEPRPKQPVLTYREVWQPQERQGHSPQAIVRRVLCLVDHAAHGLALGPVIEQAHPGCEVVFLVCEGDASGLGNAVAVVRDDLEGFTAAFEQVRQRMSQVDICYHALGACDIYYCERYQGLLYSLQAIMAARLPVGRLLLLARYPQPRMQAQVESWLGFVRSLPMVMPQTRVSLLACQDNHSTGALSLPDWFALHVLPEALAGGDESVFYRDGMRHVAVIEALTLTDSPLIAQAGKTWFITGGMGALAQLLWRRLHAQGANLVLAGRSALTPDQARDIGALDRGIGRLFYVQADVSDEISLRRAVQQAKARFGQIHGVIHAAGAAPTTTLEAIDLADFQRVLAAKVEGTRALLRVFEPEALSWHVQFSSSSAILGDFGSCSYAVANRYQSAFAQARNDDSSTRHIVINWPLWRDGAMGLNSRREERFYLDGSGQDYLETSDALALFEQILATAVPQAIVLVGSNNPLQRRLPGHTPVVQDVPGVIEAVQPSSAAVDAQQVRQWVLEAIEEQLKLPAERIRTSLNWTEMGFDSIKLAQLGKQLSQRLGCNLTPATFFGNPSADDLIAFLARTLTTQSAPVEAVVKPPAAPMNTSGAYEPIAIVGVSGRFPGADSVDQLWENWAEGTSAIQAASACRGLRADSAGFASQSRLYGGFIDDVEAFDPLFFELSPQEAAVIDPQQRLFLQAAWHAFEDAGYLGASIRGSQCGVFVGAEESFYGEQLAHEGRINANRNATLSARIAYALDLNGPNYSLTASCSSGLVAIHQACRALHNRECTMALAGGVSLMVSSRELGVLADVMPLAQEPACRVFDQGASGLVPAEAVAAVVLKPLSQALADGDQVYGVIRSSVVNYDGRTNGILAPNPVRQAELFAQALTTAGVESGQIQLVLAHSIGMQLGDPVEVQALQQVFGTDRAVPCALSSIKPLVGHSFAASGIVDLLAMLMAMRHASKPALQGLRQVNEYIGFDRSGIAPVLSRQPWQVAPGELRRGLISTTGINGSNACLLIEEAPQRCETTSTPADMAHLILLSAPDAGRLANLAKGLLLQVTDNPSLQIEDIAFTLMQGREALECRAAWVVHSLGELRSALAGFNDGALGYRGDNPVLESLAPAQWPASPDRDALQALAASWVTGTPMPERPALKGRRTRLPLTDFLRTPCWSAVTLSGPAIQPVAEALARQDNDVHAFILAFLEQHLGLGSAQLLVDKPLRQYGMDSVLAIRLAHALEQRFQVRLSARAFHENPSLAALNAHIQQQPEIAPAARSEVAQFQDAQVIAMLDSIIHSDKSLDDVKELLK
ncbi:SDR family NAD(P)-dependent oxidoreductase [Pseudomonas sp. N3-W]|uniref:SDR family NAD(P)-dependent oxidoreductase n=1 Tax=Pseudomonas sp. N3-W TaxID=2975049 RepID=UPI00217CCC55|nr:SDR family NAD(P)-dependent oxidoreductase [Pseudomonas sp. N3-W]UWF47088.1 SDR family NAD(P)-dependent oxidoreductase [Pseudomonas sp. N3-W]